MTLKIRFHHGLGDCVQFTRLLELYRRRGIPIEVHYDRDKAAVWESAGIRCASSDGAISHPWVQDKQFNNPLPLDCGIGNKVYGNLSNPNDILPKIGSPDELWEELCETTLACAREFDKAAREKIEPLVENLPFPLILLHTKGNTLQDLKNLDDAVVSKLYTQLLDETSGSLILLDWDHRVPKLPHGRVRHLKEELGHADLATLLALFDVSSLLIGIDSGPYHLATLSNLPVLGVFHQLYPSCIALPCQRSLNLTRRRNRDLNVPRRRRWNIVEYDGEFPTGSEIARQALRLLEGCRYLTNPVNLARDIQMQQMIRDWCRQSTGLSWYADRNNTLDWLFRELKPRFAGGATIVETGGIRTQEDWSAGYSTYLFSMLADSEPGVKFYSIDDNPKHSRIAQELTASWQGQRTFMVGDSVAKLKEVEGMIDVLYLDSLDADAPGHAEHGLAEFMAAKPKLHSRSIVLIDDTVWSNGQWRGKGALAVPYALSSGWKLATSGYQVCLVQDAD